MRNSKKQLPVLDIRKYKHMITQWFEATATFYEYYHQLTICIRQRGVEHELRGDNIAYIGQCSVSQLMHLASSMQTELANLTQAVDQVDPLKPTTEMYDQLVNHTSRLNQLNDQAKTLLELAGDKKISVIEKIKSLIHELVEDAANPLRPENADYISNKPDRNYTYLSNLSSNVMDTTNEHHRMIQRIEKAKELLVDDELSLSQIAYKLHYSSVAHLARQFIKITGLTPSFFKHLKTQHPKAQYNELSFFDQLCESLSLSLSDQQREHYHQSHRRGYTLVVTNSTKTILWASSSFLGMTGYRPLDVLGKTPHFLQGPDTDRGKLSFIREQLNAAQPVEADLVNYRSNGDPYICHLRIEPLRNKQGKVTHFAAVEYAVN